MRNKKIVFSENGQHWTQTVSSAPATRQDVIKLQEMLDKSLTEFQTSETGICPNRSELYKQVFGEFLELKFFEILHKFNRKLNFG